MNWIDRLERKYGGFAIRGLIKYIVIAAAFIFVAVSLSERLYVIDEMLRLNRDQVLRGQVWRLITFIFIPPSYNIFVVFALYILYIFGKSLEDMWGSFRFNLYYFIGMLSAIIAAFITGSGSVIYLNLSIFIAFAYLNPNFKLLLFFIIPVKVKYLAWFNIFFVIFTVIFGDMPDKVAAVLSFSNFFVFFGRGFFERWILPKTAALLKKRKRKKFKVIAPPKKFEFVHRCRECGRTSKEFPNLSFGYCKICGSDYEYCEDHINNHKHTT
ncbi:rhomboid family intramembrane serine protease [Herbivorax sp. ANBcel31]|uniref:rhomboid family intramembrane serine protease n=1 Tax=Herbivorax sp. ANBcel31 TaxID=3069754 RepID=UPI0027B72C90|nr:rhomboid family intramembrane serine protease [Herbivorax sp. ANBcel31]MDQ2084827.1 rhomboid family intramembrane serine protease [Herbivorax sp. ANBcel31]